MNTQNAREHGRIILAHGEVTGHVHEVVTEAGLPPGMDAAQFFSEPDGTRTLIVIEPCELRHEEHGPIQLHPDGTIMRQFASEADARAVLGASRVAQLLKADQSEKTRLSPSWCLIDMYPAPFRQGDVYLTPAAPGVWSHRMPQREYTPEAIRNVAD